MKTFILMWNPAISSFKKEEFENIILEEWIELNWSVWDWEEAEDGDRFFMVRVGEGNTGIVMAGQFESEAWQGEDWSGKGREVFYVDLDVETIIDSDKTAYISTEELAKAIPEFDWSGGHSGQLVSQEIAEKLELLWTQFLYEHQTIFDGKVAVSYECNGENKGNITNDVLKGYLRKTHNNKCSVCGYDYKEVWGKDTNHDNDYYIFWLDKKTKVTDSVLDHIHCLCYSCRMASIDEQREKLGEPPYVENEDD